MVQQRFSNKVIIVTGAASGIGRAIALRFGSEGAQVIVNDVSNEAAEAAAQTIKDQGGLAVAAVADVSDKAQVDALFDNILERFKTVDVLVNNAGLVNVERHFLEADEAWWDHILSVNLKGTFLCSLRAAQIMARRRQGVIISMSSGGASHSHRGMAAYDASKGGIESLTRAMALDLAPYGIRVNALVPGSIDTQGMSPETKRERGLTIPLGRVGEPEDMAGPAAFLASDDASYITGHIFAIDGGLLAQQRPPQVDIFPIEPLSQTGRTRLMETPSKTHRIGVDIGGTFTDLVVFNDATGSFAVGKTLTTPQDPSQAIEALLLEVLEREKIALTDVQQLIHGTTLVTNAIIERKGSRTALLATRGFRDSIEIGRENRYELYDLMLEMPQPLVPRYLRFDVPQRTLADGATLQDLDGAFVEQLARELAANKIEAVAIAFLNSFANGNAEREARAIVERVAPDMRVSISSDVIPEIREFERTSTTITNVYVQDLVERYLHRLQTRLAHIGFDGSLFLMISSGGIVTVDTAIRFPIRLLESGPAAGALAAASYGAACGYKDLLSFDMGGTTAKFCVIDQGQPLTALDFEVDRRYRFKKGSGLPVKVPVIEMIEIGAGGGSIAHIDPLGLLKVGPESAGAEPGPVCYGRGGTQPTVTDADLVLGYLNPDYFLGGQLKIDLVAAQKAIQTQIAAPLGLSLEEAAWGIHQIVNESMANAARIHTLERGKDPHRFPVFAFGGAGPVHGFRVAQALGSLTLIVPLGAGVMSAIGFLTAPLAFDFVRSWPSSLQQVDWQKANALLSEMETEGQKLLEQSGLSSTQIHYHREADIRYVGQGHEIRVPLPSGQLDSDSTQIITAAFEQVYQRLYERLSLSVPIEIINWRVTTSGPKPEVHLHMPNSEQKISQNAQKGNRPVYFPGGYRNVPVYDRYLLLPGTQFTGPAIVEERESTVIVGQDCDCRIDEQWNIIVDLLNIFDTNA